MTPWGLCIRAGASVTCARCDTEVAQRLVKGPLGRQMAHLAYGRMALQKVTDMTNVDLATLRTFDLRPYVTPRAVVTSASHLSVDLAHTPTLGPA